MAYMFGQDVEDKIALTARNLPPNLKHLTLDLKGTDITNDILATLALALPRGLETLDLNISDNPKLENPGVEQLLAKLPPHMVGLKLDLDGTAVTKEVHEKRHSLDDLRQHIIDEAEKGQWC